MEPGALLPAELDTPTRDQTPVRFIPTPSAPYQQQHRIARLLEQPAEPGGEPQAVAAAEADDEGADAPPLPHAFGARVLMWKQDPSVGEIGTRRAYLPGPVLAGPRDARIAPGSPGIDAVEPNAFGDFVTQPDTPQFDAVHTFAVVRQTLTMYQRALLVAGLQMPLPWQWNTSMDTRPLAVFPYGLPNVMNAFYSRTQGCLKFGDFVPAGEEARVYTCRSFDIVAHETAHAVLDGLKPQWLLADAPPQTGGLHEAFGDLTAIFLALSQLDQCEAVVAQTKAHLHDKTFLSDIAEQFGLALGGSTGLRNADNDLTLGQAGTQVHAISQVFTGAMYDVLADMFAYERNPLLDDDAAVLHRVAAYLRGLLLRALIAAPDSAASYVDVVNEMLRIVAEDGRPAPYAAFIRNQFARRDVVEQPQSAAGAAPAAGPLAPKVCDKPGARQDRRACCGTMNLPEYHRVDKVLDGEARALARWCAANGRMGECVVPVVAEPAAADRS
ncbi:hypothetical protein [Massilia yuzhufengensis]|uniref:Uncharacterized protein n=1 Tax=Massilia yuzhufengensis TaxID=1164594 RepID=A0A1I1G1R4_9BURK|nr:hypothetical protein [Massilia yuzhufengensis]SFC03110.1 hypothetical protein SAMN05216204_103106 [Massilia yuzhufengensis]